MENTENSQKVGKHGLLTRLARFLKGKNSEGTEKSLLRLKETREQLMVYVVGFALTMEFLLFPTLAYHYYTSATKSSMKNGFIVNESAKEKVVVVDFNEEITIKTYHKIYTIFEGFKKDKSVREVVLVMNTPGGSPAASEEIAYYLKNYKAKKVHLYVQSIAASGGYYIASVFSPIISNPNAIVGSIGVILPKYSLEKLSKTIGVEDDPIVAGKYKHMVSMLKKTDPETKAYLKENLLYPTYENFLNHVSKHRGVSVKELKDKYAEGRVFSAYKPEIRGKLVDEIKNFNDLKEGIISGLIKGDNDIKSEEDVSLHFVMLDQVGEGNMFFKDMGLNVNINSEGLLNPKVGLQ